MAQRRPDGDLGNDGPIAEGSSASVSFTGQADPSDADTTAGLRSRSAARCGSRVGDGAGRQHGGDQRFRGCSFADDGVKSVRARILDKDGDFTEYTTAVTVTNDLPEVTPAADQSADEGETSSISLGSFTDAGANDDPWSVDVDWGDGSTHSAFGTATRGALDARSHEYADDGTYTVKVKVTDKDGGSDTASFVATVKNVAPTVKLDTGNALSLDEGQTRTYTYAISDPGADTVSAIDTSCGADGQKVGSATHDDTSGSFQCSFPDGPADTIVSASRRITRRRPRCRGRADGEGAQRRAGADAER